MLVLALGFASASPLDPAAAALDAWRAGLPRADALVEGRADVVRWPGGWRVRVRPVVDGLPVDGSSQVVALGPDGAVLRVVGAPSPIHAVPRGGMTAAEALTRAEDLADALGTGLLAPPRVDEVALAAPSGRGGLRHAWRVELAVADPFQTWVAWFDAEDGRVTGPVPTGHASSGRVYPISPVHGPPAFVDLEHLEPGFVLRGTYADAWSCTDPSVGGDVFAFDTCDTVERQAVPISGDWLYVPRPGSSVDPFAEVNLYHQVTRAAAFFDGRYGLRDPEPLRVYANFPFANAFYGDFDGDGRGDLSFGRVPRADDRPPVQFAYDADVVVHEFGHWVVGRIADIPMLTGDSYGLEWAGGSLNEGAADVFAMALTGDPRVGEYAGGAFGASAIRDLDADRRCPDDLRGEVHADGEIIGALGWDLIGLLGPERASDLLFGAVATWGPDVDWAFAGQSLLDAADDLRAAGLLDATEHASATARIEASGMPGCGRVIPLDDGRTPDPFVLSAGLVGPLERIPGGTQFSVDLGVAPDRLVVDVLEDATPDGLAWSLFVRCGAPVENAPTELAALGLGFSVPTVWDWTLDGEGPGRLVIDASSAPPLPSGGTCFVEVAGRTGEGLPPLAFTLGRITVGARAERAAHPPPETRGCAVLPGASGGLALGALLALRRRRAGG